MKLKVGQEITFEEDFELKTFGGKKINIKEGNKGIVIRDGYVRHLNGDAMGLVQKLNPVEIVGYDYDNISKLIVDRLIAALDLDKLVIFDEINYNDAIDEVLDVLSGII